MYKHGVIYGLQDPTTGELRYIGQTTKTIVSRIRAHLTPSHLKRHSHLARWLKGLVERGLSPTWTQLAIAQSQNELDNLEIMYITQAKKQGFRLVNLSGGGGGRFGYVPPQEEREKIRLGNLGKPHPKHTPEWREHMSQIMRGRRTNTPEHMCELARAKRGVPRPPEVRAKIAKAKRGSISPKRGIPLTDETKAKISASRKGKLQGSSHHQYRHDIATEDILSRLTKGQSKIQIAADLGVSPTFIHRRLNRVGRPSKPKFPIDLVRQRLSQGLSLRAIANELGVSTMTLWRRMREAT